MGSDPIEVGAAAAVLRSRVVPLRMTAAKSRMGHAEPAAGTVGIMAAMGMLRQGRVNALTSLRTINPHVISIFSTARQAGDGAALLPRHDAHAASGGPDAVTGVSSFAFQGTNAHAVLSVGPEGGAEIGPSKDSPIQRHRFWYASPAHQLLHSAIISGPQRDVTFQTQINRACLGYLFDHQIQGRVLLPGAAMFEMSASALGGLLSSGSSTNGQSVVVGVGISAPFVLTTGSGGQILSCTVRVATGRIEVRSMAATSKGSQLHLTGKSGEYRSCGQCHLTLCSGNCFDA